MRGQQNIKICHFWFMRSRWLPELQFLEILHKRDTLPPSVNMQSVLWGRVGGGWCIEGSTALSLYGFRKTESLKEAHTLRNSKILLLHEYNPTKQCAHSVTLSSVRATIVAVKRQEILHILSVYLWVRSIQCACPIFSYVTCPVLQRSSTLSQKRNGCEKKNVIEHMMCVLIFFTPLKHFSLSEELREIWSKMYIGLHVNVRF